MIFQIFTKNDDILKFFTKIDDFLKRGAERLLLKIFAYLVESADRSTNPGQAN